MAINNKVSEAAREVIGQFLKETRTEKGISAYRICKDAGLASQQVTAIESGSTNYTVDALFAYLEAVDLYVFFAPKSGKDRSELLDEEDILKKANSTDPNL